MSLRSARRQHAVLRTQLQSCTEALQRKGLQNMHTQSPAPVINTPKQLKSCSKGVLLELLSIVYSDPGKAFKCNAASSSPQNGLKIILQVKQKGRDFNIKMPSSSQ